MKSIIAVFTAGLIGLVATQTASASLITNFGTTDVVRTGNFDLSSDVDWRFFDTIAGGGNSQLGGANAISNPVFDNNGSTVVQAALGTIPTNYNWTDGMAGGTGGAANMGTNPNDVFMRDTGMNLSGSGANLTMTIVGKTTPQIVSIYGPKRWVAESFTASLAGTTSQTVTGSTPIAGPTEVFRTDITFTADNDGDLLTLVLQGANSNTLQAEQRLGIQAVTVSEVAVVPEPASIALMGFAGLGMFMRRKRII